MAATSSALPARWGHSVTDLVTALAADKSPSWAKELGGAGYPPAGGTVNASYILEPAVRDPLRSARQKRRTSALSEGMFSEFRVSGPRVAGALPNPDIIVREVDYKWNVSRPVTAGSHVLRVTNDGTHVHEMKILRVLPGHTYGEVKAWKPGQPRIDETFATVTTMSPGVSVITSIDFQARRLCPLVRAPSKHGMTQPLRIEQ